MIVDGFLVCDVCRTAKLKIEAADPLIAKRVTQDGRYYCCYHCWREQAWRDLLKQEGKDYYPDPRYFDKLGRPLPSWTDHTLGS